LFVEDTPMTELMMIGRKEETSVMLNSFLAAKVSA
jgi:hypothetical protein